MAEIWISRLYYPRQTVSARFSDPLTEDKTMTRIPDETLSRYLDGQMSDAERDQLEELLATDDEARRQMDDAALKWMLPETESAQDVAAGLSQFLQEEADRLAEHDYWTLESLPGQEVYQVISGAPQIDGVVHRPATTASAGQSPVDAVFPVTVRRVADEPPTLEFRSEGWPEGWELVGLELARWEPFPRQPFQQRWPGRWIVGAGPRPFVRRPKMTDESGAAWESAEAAACYDMAADTDPTAGHTAELPQDFQTEDFRVQCTWGSDASANVLVRMPGDRSEDFVVAEIQARNQLGEDISQRHLLRVTPSELDPQWSDWKHLPLAGLNVDDAAPLTFCLRSLQKDDLVNDPALCREFCQWMPGRSVLAKRQADAHIVRLRWSHQQAAANDPAGIWLLEVQRTGRTAG